MTDVRLDPRDRLGEYGIDGDFNVVPAMWQLVIVTVLSLALAGGTVTLLVAGALVAGIVTGVVTLLVLCTVATYLYTTRRGKFVVWARILADLRLRGDEELLDLGCGRGATLLAAATLLPTGRAVGIDLWRADETGNSPAATRLNAEGEGVADGVELHAGDMTRLPFADHSFDVVISSIAIHNIPSTTGRRAAIDEGPRAAAGRAAGHGGSVGHQAASGAAAGTGAVRRASA